MWCLLSTALNIIRQKSEISHPKKNESDIFNSERNFRGKLDFSNFYKKEFKGDLVDLRHLSLKVPNIEFNINALIGNLKLGFDINAWTKIKFSFECHEKDSLFTISMFDFANRHRYIKNLTSKKIWR